MPGVEKAESLLGDGAGGFSPAGNRGHNCSYTDVHSTVLVSEHRNRSYLKVLSKAFTSLIKEGRHSLCCLS